MREVNYKPRGVCAVLIHYELDDDGKMHNLSFVGGCNGNLKAIGCLLEGSDGVLCTALSLPVAAMGHHVRLSQTNKRKER